MVCCCSGAAEKNAFQNVIGIWNWTFEILSEKIDLFSHASDEKKFWPLSSSLCLASEVFISV